MSWVQVKSPNLNVQTSMGMCLKYVQDAFGSGWAGSYALQGWRDIVKKKHTNRNIPGGVYVPIWFEGEWDGYNYGHVAIYKDGVCWSSPYANKGTHDQLGNIETVERIYGMKYIGWSEDIGGTTVIRKGDSDMIPDEYHLNIIWQLIMNEGAAPKNIVNEYVNKKTYTELLDVLVQQVNYKYAFAMRALGQAAYDGGWEKRLKDQSQKIKELEASKSGEFVEIKEKVYKKK